MAEAVKTVTLLSPHVHDVAPGIEPPRTLIIEAWRRRAACSSPGRRLPGEVILAKITRAAFHADAAAGDRLLYHAEIAEYRWKAHVVARRRARSARREVDLMFVHLGRGQDSAGRRAVLRLRRMFESLLRLNRIIAAPASEPEAVSAVRRVGITAWVLAAVGIGRRAFWRRSSPGGAGSGRRGLSTPPRSPPASPAKSRTSTRKRTSRSARPEGHGPRYPVGRGLRRAGARRRRSRRPAAAPSASA